MINLSQRQVEKSNEKMLVTQTLFVKISQKLKIHCSKDFYIKKLIFIAFLSEKITNYSQLCNKKNRKNIELHRSLAELANQSNPIEKFGKLLKSCAKLVNKKSFTNIELFFESQRAVILNFSSKQGSAKIYE